MPSSLSVGTNFTLNRSVTNLSVKAVGSLPLYAETVLEVMPSGFSNVLVGNRSGLTSVASFMILAQMAWACLRWSPTSVFLFFVSDPYAKRHIRRVSHEPDIPVVLGRSGFTNDRNLIEFLYVSLTLPPVPFVMTVRSISVIRYAVCSENTCSGFTSCL